MIPNKNSTVKHTSQFRMPTDLAEWLKKRAEANTRTVNGELVARLKEARQREEQEAAHA